MDRTPGRYDRRRALRAARGFCGACTRDALGSPAPDLFSRLCGMELSNNALPLCSDGLRHARVRGACRRSQTWRILEVTDPDDVPAHTKVQKLYFGDDFMLRR